MNRNKWLRRGVIVVMAIILGRLFQIQILQHGEWSDKAAAQQTLQNVLVAKRGEIYMMDGEEVSPVVLNATVYTVIVDPMTTDEGEIEELSEILGEKRVAEWSDVFADKERRYYIVGKNVERRAAEKIAELDITGVWLQSNTKRVYPEGTLGSTMLGFVNLEGQGQYGVEGSLDGILSGTNGMLKSVKDINNVALSIGDDNVKIPAVDGENLVLSIDKNIQNGVEEILEKKSGELGFANMSALVMDPRNGEILAMADYPGYDPANFGQVENAEAYINHAVEDPYEPASVCKALTFATGLEFGVLTPESTYVNYGVTEVDGAEVENAYKGVLGVQTIQTGLNYSLNTASTQALRWLGGSNTEITQQGRERLYEYYHDKFGLGQYTGIELLESPGWLIEPNAEIYGLNKTYADMTYGQNLSLTMIQVAAAYAALVNGGEYYTPTMVAGVMRDGEFVKGKLVDGEFVEGAQAEPVRRAVSEETSATMRQMLYGTRSAWRTRGVDPAGYEVGGKTGTAQVIVDGEYSFDETVATYIGYGGTAGEMPEYLIMVRIWEEGKRAEGEAAALPTFNELKAFVQDYLRVAPSV